MTFRRPRLSCPPIVTEGLQDLLKQTTNPIDRRYVLDMIMYAQIGRDRRKLTMDWVEEIKSELGRRTI